MRKVSYFIKPPRNATAEVPFFAQEVDMSAELISKYGTSTMLVHQPWLLRVLDCYFRAAFGFGDC